MISLKPWLSVSITLHLLTQPRMLIQPNQFVILQQPDNFMRLVQLKPGAKIDLAKYGKIQADDLFGKSLESTYELTRDGLTELKVADDAVVDGEMLPNNVIFDDNTSQRLSHEQITKMKADMEEGAMNPSQLIDAVISNSDSFARKNAFAKVKYRRRKESKFARWVRVRACTIDSLVEYHQARDHEKVGFLRADSMAQLLCLGNVFEGQRVLVVDETRGLVLGAAATLNQTGMTMAVYSGPYFQPYLFEHFNLPDTLLYPIESSHLAPTRAPVTPPEENSTEKFLERHARLLRGVQTVQSAQCDSLLVAVTTHRFDLAQLEPLIASLKPSSPIAIFAPYLALLSDLFAGLMVDPRFVDVRLTEPWMRAYQTAAGRCHPTMSMSGHGGYLLSACLVIP